MKTTILSAFIAAASGFFLGTLVDTARAETPKMPAGGPGAAAGFSGQDGCFVVTRQDGPSSFQSELIVIRDKKVFRISLDGDAPKDLKPWGKLD